MTNLSSKLQHTASTCILLGRLTPPSPGYHDLCLRVYSPRGLSPCIACSASSATVYPKVLLEFDEPFLPVLMKQKLLLRVPSGTDGIAPEVLPSEGETDDDELNPETPYVIVEYE